MLGIFKKFWSRSDGDTPFAAPAAPPKPSVPVSATTRAGTGTLATARPPAASASRSPSQAPKPAVGAPSNHTGFINVTLGAIEPSLPEQLRHKIAGALQDVIPVPVNQVVPQLGGGSVVLTIRQLRGYAPELLASLAGHDELAITLPLSEIVPQLDRALFTRREPLKRLQVPDDVTSVFTKTTSGTILTNAVVKPIASPLSSAAPAAHTVSPSGAAHAPAARPGAAAPAAATPANPKPVTAKPAATPAAPAAAPAAKAPAPAIEPPTFAPAADPAAAEPERKISLSSDAFAALAAATKGAPAQPAPARATNAAANPFAAPVRGGLPGSPGSTFAPAPAPAAPRPAPVAPAPAPARPAPANDKTPAAAPLVLPLSKLADSLPVEVLEELTDVDVPGTNIHLPMALVEAGLKSGKVLFAWNDLAGWLQPPLPRLPSRTTGEILVELPLKAIAPAFMAHHRGAAATRKADVGDGIPDLFQGGTGAEAAPRPGAPLPPTSMAAPAAPVAAPPAPAPARAVAATPARPAAPAPAAEPARAAAAMPRLEDIIGPAAQRFSPKQIVQNAAKLSGVSGTLLALADGLPVAHALQSSVNPETVAAFLPQIFGRMSHYTKELGMGALQSLALHVEGGCWQVYKQPNIYFAVCGKAGEPMPFNLLAQIAAELSKQSV